MDNIVIVENVSKTYEQGELSVYALSDVSVAIERGGFVSLCGPSGSGKSTLLNLIGGLDRPTSGRITVDGKSIEELSRSDLALMRLMNIGFIFQAYNLIPVLSAQENVEFVLQLQGASAEERHAKSRRLLREVGLEGLEKRRPAELSGGQQQRVAVARAMVSNPSIILADEPTANLDSKTATSLLELMREMNQSHSVTFIFSTHDQNVMQYARRLIHLHDGRIVSDERKESD